MRRYLRPDERLEQADAALKLNPGLAHFIVSSGRPGSGGTGLVACEPGLNRWELAHLGVGLREFFLGTVINTLRGMAANGVLAGHRVWAQARLEAVMRERIFVVLNGTHRCRGVVFCPPLSLGDLAYLFLVRLGHRPSRGLWDIARAAEDRMHGNDLVRLTFHHRALNADDMVYSVDIPFSMLNL